MTKTSEQTDKATSVGIIEWLAGQKEWLAAVKSKGWKMRAGGKSVIDTKTYKVSCLPTIEVAQPGKRKYLPLSLPNGMWYFDSEQMRDDVMKLLVAS